MPNKKGGLGNGNTGNNLVTNDDADLLDSVFGEATAQPLDKDKKIERIAKHFMIEKQLAKEIKLYAVENDMKELEVIDLALRSFLASKKAE